MGKNDEARVAALALTGIALIVEPTTGVLSLISRIASLGVDKIRDHELDKLGERFDTIEQRVEALEQSHFATRKLGGNPLRLLAYSVYREGTELFIDTDAIEAKTALDQSPEEYVEAARELKFLNLVTIRSSSNHAGGIAGTKLCPSTFLSAAPTLLPNVDLPSEMQEFFNILRRIPKEQYRISVTDILKQTSIPLPRFDLILIGLEDVGFLIGHGMGNDQWGSYMDIEITPGGRRILRGDDPLPV